MRESKIRKLIKLVEESGIDELEVSSWGRKVRITKKLNSINHNNSAETQNLKTTNVSISVPKEAKAGESASKPVLEENTDHWVPIRSPMVGTFYRAPSPGAKSYVELNQEIEEGQVVCIIEAMKLMNEIEAEVSGRVAKILVENATPVEYSQVLFFVDPKKR